VFSIPEREDGIDVGRESAISEKGRGGGREKCFHQSTLKGQKEKNQLWGEK